MVPKHKKNASVQSMLSINDQR